MKKYKVELLNPAWIDLDTIANYHLHEVGLKSACKITDKILSSLEQLEAFPFSCPLVPYKELAALGYRMLVCEKYICLYKISGYIVYVHHITPAAADYPVLFQ
jgi:hypothetical protein